MRKVVLEIEKRVPSKYDVFHVATVLWDDRENWPMRFMAEMLLGRISGEQKEALDFLRDTCSLDSVWFVKEGLAYAVGEVCRVLGIEKSFSLLEKWTHHSSEAVRRAVSEGIRMKPYWKTPCPGLKEQPERIISLLKNLREDPSLFVCKSVGNNLSDISLVYPEQVFNTIKSWLTETSYNKRTHLIARRASRKLVKNRKEDILSVLKMDKYKDIT